MKLDTTNSATTPRAAGLLLALGAGIVAYAWHRKTAGKPMLPAFMSAIAVATGASSTVHGLARRFLRNSDAGSLPTDGRLAEQGDKKRTSRKGKEHNP